MYTVVSGWLVTGRGHFADAVTRRGQRTSTPAGVRNKGWAFRQREDDWRLAALAAEYVARADRLAPLFPRARPLPARLPAYPPDCPAGPDCALPPDLASELQRSLLYAPRDDELWNGKPQQYFESMHYGERPPDDADYDSDSLQP
uniref:Uncharacterized protein n=1 Tax=Heliothis virescens TaxID=7102 RepID=A0A2A4K6A5_HELVI